MAVPKKDSELATYSTNFNTRGVASPTDFALTSAEMTAYTALHTPWIAAYNACNSEGGKSKSLVAAKDTAKANLLPYARQLYTLIQSSLTVSDANKTLMGVTIKKTPPSPMPPPAMAPLVTPLSVIGRVATFKLADATAPTSKRKPLNAVGATIMSATGATPPPDNDPGWQLQGQTGKMTFQVQFGNDVAAGTPCWVVALWYSRRGDYSPACSPVQVYLQVAGDSSSESQAESSDEQPELRKAA